MGTEFTSEHERQRIRHLVLGEERPKPPRRRRKKGLTEPVRLLPGVEEAVARREAWSQKSEGTPETHEHVAREAGRAGALARLRKSGAIDDRQLQAAVELRAAHESVANGAVVRTVDWQRRGGGGGVAVPASLEGPHDWAYRSWLRAVGRDAGPVLAIVVDDMALTAAAKLFARSTRTMTQILTRSLDAWRG